MILVCWKASLISFGETLNWFWVLVGIRYVGWLGFWIWVMVMAMVIVLYMWSLLRYLVACFSPPWESKPYWGGCFHATSRRLYWKIFIGDIYECVILHFLVKTWCERWLFVDMLESEVWGGVLILHIWKWCVWPILGRLLLIVLGCWLWIMIVCLCNVCDIVRAMLCRCRSPQWRDPSS